MMDSLEDNEPIAFYAPVYCRAQRTIVIFWSAPMCKFFKYMYPGDFLKVQDLILLFSLIVNEIKIW